jgi:malate dehydrogenase (quinone)
MLDVLSKCFPKEMKSSAVWQNKLKQMIPTYGQHLMDDKNLATKQEHGRINFLD